MAVKLICYIDIVIFPYRLGLILLFNLLLLTPISCQVTNGTNVTQAESEQEQSVLKESTVYVAPKSLNFIDCYHRMDTGPQAAYICGGNQELLPLLLYAEQEGKEICEKTFQDELWNCTGFSILKEPKITKGGKCYLFKKYLYICVFSMYIYLYTTHTFRAVTCFFTCFRNALMMCHKL